MNDITARKAGFTSGRKPKKNLIERNCQVSSCDTKLSIYNKKKFCFLHAPLTYPRVRGHLPRGDK